MSTNVLLHISVTPRSAIVLTLKETINASVRQDTHKVQRPTKCAQVKNMQGYSMAALVLTFCKVQISNPQICKIFTNTTIEITCSQDVTTEHRCKHCNIADSQFSS